MEDKKRPPLLKSGKKRKAPPKGWFEPGKLSGAEAEKLIRTRLEQVEKEMPGSRARVHIYGDGSIDGEIAIKIKRGVDADDVASKAEDAMGRIGVDTGIWVSMGARYVIKQDDEIYRRYKGMNDVGVYYQRANRANIGEVFLILRNTIIKGLKKKYRRKAEMIYIRLHWNAKGKQPKAMPHWVRYKKRKRKQ